MNEKITVSYFEDNSLIKDVDHIIAIEKNYFLLVDRKNKIILIYSPNDSFVFDNFDDEYICYVKKLNNDDIFIYFEKKFSVIKINFETKSYDNLIIYNMKNNIDLPNLSEFYNENKLLLLGTNNILIFEYKKQLNNKYRINLETIINNENDLYYDYIYRYSYHPKNNKKEFVIISEIAILFYNTITYQINDKIEQNSYLSENGTNVIEWINNYIFICHRNCFYLLDTNNHKIIYKCNSLSTTIYRFESIQLLDNNLIIIGIFIRGCFSSDFEIRIFSLDNLYDDFYSFEFLYKENIKGGLVNLVVSEEKDYFGVIYGKDSQFKYTFGKINYIN